MNNAIRILDVDDLYILSYLLENKLLSDASRGLKLSQAAITQRVHKMESFLGTKILERKGITRILTPRGRKFAVETTKALAVLQAIVLEENDLATFQQSRPKVKREPKVKKSDRCGFLGPSI